MYMIFSRSDTLYIIYYAIDTARKRFNRRGVDCNWDFAHKEFRERQSSYYGLTLAHLTV